MVLAKGCAEPLMTGFLGARASGPHAPRYGATLR